MDTEKMISKLNDFDWRLKGKVVPVFVNELIRLHKDIIPKLEKLMDYEEIGTVGDFRDFAGKHIPARPILNDLCTCPKCGTHNESVKKRRNTVNEDIVYCLHCGQAMEVRRYHV